MLRCVLSYFVTAWLFGLVIDAVVEFGMMYELPEFNVFKHRLVRYVSIILISVFWIITLPITVYSQWKE